jgi:hypothetical protein
MAKLRTLNSGSVKEQIPKIHGKRRFKHQLGNPQTGNVEIFMNRTAFA